MSDDFLVLTIVYFPSTAEYKVEGISLRTEMPVLLQGEPAKTVLQALAKKGHTTIEEMFSYNTYPKDVIVSIKEFIIDDDFDTDDNS